MESYGTLLATVEGEWLATAAARLRLGWDHGFGIEPATVNYLFTSDRLIFDGRYSLGGGCTLSTVGLACEWPNSAAFFSRN